MNHPVAALWLACGLIDLQINVLVMVAFELGGIPLRTVEDQGRAMGLSRAMTWGLLSALSLVLGPAGLGMTVAKLPRWRRRWTELRR